MLFCFLLASTFSEHFFLASKITSVCSVHSLTTILKLLKLLLGCCYVFLLPMFWIFWTCMDVVERFILSKELAKVVKSCRCSMLIENNGVYISRSIRNFVLCLMF